MEMHCPLSIQRESSLVVCSVVYIPSQKALGVGSEFSRADTHLTLDSNDAFAPGSAPGSLEALDHTSTLNRQERCNS